MFPIEDQAPMLADQHQKIAPTPIEVVRALAAQGFLFDEKLDGVRALMHVHDGKVRIINRRGVDTTHRYPEIVAAFEAQYPGRGHRVFDGEICCYTDDRPDFAKTHRRDAQSKAASIAMLVKTMPADYVAFDLLWDGNDLRSQPFVTRRALLLTETKDWGERLRMVQFTGPGMGETFYKTIVGLGGEGLIAKSKLSTYRAGRAAAWVKIKPTFSLSVVLVGYKEGNGRRANLPGAFQMALIGPDGPLAFGEVGTGFKDRDLVDLKERLDSGQLLVAEVVIQNITADGKPRFPSFKGIRSDVAPTDCTVDQLIGVPVIGMSEQIART